MRNSQVPSLIEELALVEETFGDLLTRQLSSKLRLTGLDYLLPVGIANVRVGISFHCLERTEAFTISCQLSYLKSIFREILRASVDFCTFNQFSRKRVIESIVNEPHRMLGSW
jgi:hypothetical protein